MRIADQVLQNLAVAADTLRASKTRSALTILGVIIGVATVMSMAAIVSGISSQIVRTIEIAGPSTFYVIKVFSETPINPDRLPAHVRIRPDLERREAERLADLPEIAYASIWAQAFGRVEFNGVRTQMLTVMGADDGFTRIQGGELVEGRWFTRGELAGGASVAVIDEDVARKVFGRERAIGRTVRVGGRPMEVIGLYQPPGNIFSPPGQQIGAIVPFLLLDRQFTIDRTNALWIPVKPRAGVSVAEAQEAVTITMRELRRLRPGDRNSFDLMTQDQILDTFNKLTGVFFLVMIVLSAVALLVGGIGVMAIMMVSVTSRTREIGLRKAVGATKRDIMLQFLVEAVTLTGIGGVIGILTGLALARVVGVVMDIEATPPVSMTATAVGVSVAIGIAFGLLPAIRAARLDPIEALRYE